MGNVADISERTVGARGCVAGDKKSTRGRPRKTESAIGQAQLLAVARAARETVGGKHLTRLQQAAYIGFLLSGQPVEALRLTRSRLPGATYAVTTIKTRWPFPPAYLERAACLGPEKLGDVDEVARHERIEIAVRVVEILRGRELRQRLDLAFSRGRAARFPSRAESDHLYQQACVYGSDLESAKRRLLRDHAAKRVPTEP